MDALLEAFGIDWKLLLAQALNFGVLAFMLTKFLFKPMFRVLDERVEKARGIEIGAKEIADARESMEQWQAEQEAAVRAKADVVLREATEAADARKREMLARTEEELVLLRERTRREIEQERARVFEEAQGELSGLALAAAERVLGREVNRSDTERLVQEALN